MATTREKKIVQLMFGTHAYTLAIKLNSDKKIAISLKKLFVRDRITFLLALY